MCVYVWCVWGAVYDHIFLLLARVCAAEKCVYTNCLLLCSPSMQQYECIFEYGLVCIHHTHTCTHNDAVGITDFWDLRWSGDPDALRLLHPPDARRHLDLASVR